MGNSRYFKTIKPGDSAYIWQSIDYRYPGSNKPNGVYAKATIVSVPPHTPQYQAIINQLKKRDTGAWRDLNVEQHQKMKPTVLIRYDSSYALNPLTAAELRAAGLGNMGPFQFKSSGIYRLTDIEAHKIEGLLKSKGP